MNGPFSFILDPSQSMEDSQSIFEGLSIEWFVLFRNKLIVIAQETQVTTIFAAYLTDGLESEEY